ncbi:MAG: hypothetical protein Q8M26_11200 [Pseudolabrys sp.]|nr:hypothetical protein [Pseudolabrys sp.]
MPSKKLGPMGTSETASGTPKTLRDADARLSQVRPKLARPQSTTQFIETSKNYRGSVAGVSFERPLGMKFRRRLPLDKM